MTELKVPNMHCEKCVERISAALSGQGLNFRVSLPDKTVAIDGCAGCVAKAKAALEDLGFDTE